MTLSASRAVAGGEAACLRLPPWANITSLSYISYTIALSPADMYYHFRQELERGPPGSDLCAIEISFLRPAQAVCSSSLQSPSRNFGALDNDSEFLCNDQRDTRSPSLLVGSTSEARNDEVRPGKGKSGAYISRLLCRVHKTS